MSDDKKFQFGILTPYSTMKAYHRPGWEHYAAKVEAERAKERENAKVVLKEKRRKMGNILYTFSVRPRKNQKPYLVITGNIEKSNYKGSIVVFSPHLPDFLRVVQQLSKEFGL